LLYFWPDDTDKLFAWTIKREAPLNVLIPLVVAFYFHFFFLTMLFVAGIAERLPALFGISLATVAISLSGMAG
jgi:hypothetical protein